VSFLDDDPLQTVGDSRYESIAHARFGILTDVLSRSLLVDCRFADAALESGSR
jgi:hypothetical protein